MKNEIYKWFLEGRPIVDDAFHWVAGCGGGIEPNDEYGGYYLSSKAVNYAVELSGVGGYNDDLSTAENANSLNIYELRVCSRIVKDFINALGMESFVDAMPNYVCGANSPMRMIETKYGLSLFVMARWDGSTYAGDVYFPVDGICQSASRGLLCVTLILHKTDCTKMLIS